MSTRLARPMAIDKHGQAVPLQRVMLGSEGDKEAAREAFVQNLVHDHPDLVPMAEIAPPYTPLISVCKELPTSAGFLDNLWVTPDGGVVIGEAKLFRNPQARREVVAQALDYARAIAGMHYEDFEKAVRLARKDPTFKLWDLVRERSDLDEPQFIDAVTRRLRQGHFIVLVIGDGIQEGAEALASFLQLHAGLRVGLALVDLSIWSDAEGRRLVVPRVPLNTVLVERGVVTIKPSGEIAVEAPAVSAAARVDTRPITLSEQEFFDQLEQRRPGVALKLRAFVKDVEELGVVPEFRKSLVLRWNASPDFNASPGYIGTDGYVWLSNGWNSARRLGNEAAGMTYLGTIASLVGGHIRNPARNWPDVSGPDGKQVDVGELLEVAAQWKAAIDKLMTDTRSGDTMNAGAA